MKTVITSEGNKITSTFDKRFGRAAWFCVYDKNSGETTFLENEYVNANNGAGTKAAEKMIELNVTNVISGDFGPKAKELLEKFDIQMIILENEGMSILDVINKMKRP